MSLRDQVAKSFAKPAPEGRQDLATGAPAQDQNITGDELQAASAKVGLQHPKPYLTPDGKSPNLPLTPEQLADMAGKDVAARHAREALIAGAGADKAPTQSVIPAREPNEAEKAKAWQERPVANPLEAEEVTDGYKDTVKYFEDQYNVEHDAAAAADTRTPEERRAAADASREARAVRDKAYDNEDSKTI